MIQSSLGALLLAFTVAGKVNFLTIFSIGIFTLALLSWINGILVKKKGGKQWD